jgi:surface carbohydrate biosynthesis protein
MWNLLILIRLILKSKIQLKRLKKTDLIIFDEQSVFDLRNIIPNFNYFVLQTRSTNINKIYFNLEIFFKLIKNYNGNIFTAYLTSIIQVVNPKIVITTIDNSIKFFEISKIFEKKIKFIAIQNAARYEIGMHKYLFHKKIVNYDLTKKFYITNFYCFGDHEIYHYKKNKVKVKQFKKVGSLRLENFIKYIRDKKIKTKKNKYDVCLISEYSIGKDILYQKKGIDKSFALVAKFTIQYCLKNKLKFCFALKRQKNNEHNQMELKFYRDYLSPYEYKYLLKNSVQNDRKKFSSYRLIAESNVVVGLGSTLLRDKLALNGKILSLNLSRMNFFDFPIKGLCSLNKGGYSEFAKRLKTICKLTNAKYALKLSKKGSYLINFNKHYSAIETIKKDIKKSIN